MSGGKKKERELLSGQADMTRGDFSRARRRVRRLAPSLVSRGGDERRATEGGAESSPSDAALVQACAAGKRAAAETLIRRHRFWVLRLAHSRLQHVSEAEDVTQDVFASVWQKAGQWDAARGQFTTWLYTITVNRCIDVLRRRRPMAELEAAEHVPDETADTAQQSADKERRQVLRAALQSLSAPQRAALELVYFAEFPQARAAAALGVSVEALESSLRRGRTRLRELLQAEKSALLAP